MSDQRSDSPPPPFPTVPSGYPFPELEQEVLETWRRERIFERTLECRQGAPRFTFYEGPPTANNKPHVGHVVTRVVKDLFPRYRTMRGFLVERMAGWDTHGLPVEIEVEKQLGFSGKEEIERYGIEAFNRACKDSVFTYVEQWRAMTERVGFWLDLDDPYITYSNRYIESAWWALAELWQKDLLYEGFKIQPYCPRCGTSLSSHEVAQNYKETDDPSVWVLFPLRAGQTVTTVDGERLDGSGLNLVAWTTTPWTLLSHAGLVVHPEMLYRAVRFPGHDGQLLVFGDALETRVPLDSTGPDGKRVVLDLREQEVVARFRGRDLEHLRYDRPLAVVPNTELPPLGSAEEERKPLDDVEGFEVLLGDYVTASDGTGIVHTAPLFGEDDYQTGLRYGLPALQAVDRKGRVDLASGFDEIDGEWFKDADPKIVRRLRETGRLLHTESYRHSYPFCWRCDRPLAYYALSSWFVRSTAAKEELVAKNREIDWHPEHIGAGRFGDWLENVVDWALSRSRYWGTPLPVWRCEACQAVEVVGSFDTLFERAGLERPADPYDEQQFDPHRPFIDEVRLPCSACDGSMRRVPEVIDAWFDSGSMPFAQHHYPFENTDRFAEQFPADFISEAVDQTRGWFYTLHVLATLLFDSVAFRHCIVLGHVNDEKGRKMSKRLGNVVEPMAVIAETGADAMRWYFYSSNPEVPSRFSSRLVREAAQGFMLPLWNALSFFTIYANLDGWHPEAGESTRVAHAERPYLDRYILARLDRLVQATTEHLEAYAISEAARDVESFLDVLTNWYIRRSRDRFWAAKDDGASDDKASAYEALYEVLTTLAKLLAPFTPFLADVMHGHLVRSQTKTAPASVHLEDWPEARTDRAEPELEASMATLQRIVTSGHAARNAHDMKTRQPLAAVTIVAADPGLELSVAPFVDLLEEELNVKEVRWAKDRKEYVEHQVLPVFSKCGPRFGRLMPKVKQALVEADGDALFAQLEATGEVAIDLGDGTGGPVKLTSEEVEVRLKEREGIATHGDRDLLVALELELSPELVAEGLAREVVHRVQTARKEAGLDYADRIRVKYRADSELDAAIQRHRDWIARETLALEIGATESDELAAAPVESHDFAVAIETIRETGS